jgi:hypothetical protein
MPLVDLRVRHLCALLLGCWAANKLPLRLHPEDRDNQEKKETYMSKNLTRKGLALGAIVALGTSLFAGAPAFAGTESTGVTLAPAAGTTYTSIKGAAFDLSTVVNSNILTSSVTAAKLSYLITNAGAAPVKVAFNSALSTDVRDAVASGTAADTLGSFSTVTPSAEAAFTAKAIVVRGAGDNLGKSSANTGSNKLTLTSSTDGTDNVTFTVQAFIDENSNGQIDSFDLTSPARTVTFIPAANVTATTTIISSTIGSTKLQASVALGNDVNQANLAAGVVFVKFQKNGSDVAFSDSTVSSDATYDSTDAVLKTNKTTVSAITADTYIAQAYFGSALTTKLGSASNASVPANGSVSVDSTDFVDVTATANVKKVTTASASNTASVRSGFAGNVTFGSKITWHSTDGTEQPVGAGVTVKVTLTKVALASASTFVAGGKTLTATSGAQSFTVLTDADGKVSFTGAGTGAKDDSVTVSIEALKKTGGYTAIGRGITVTYVDAAATSFVQTDLKGASAVQKITKGASFSANYTLADQFGQALTAGTYRATISAGSGTNAAFTYYATGVAGKFTQAIVDNSTTAGSYTLTATLYKYNTTTLAWDVVTSPAAATATVVVNDVVAAAVSGSASSSTAVATIAKTLVNADLRVDANSQTQTTIGYGSAATQTISGTVTDATGAAVSGATVTVTGAGLGFVVNGNVYSVGSATINTGTNGQYSVDVYSTASGKTSVVVTSGAATKTVAIEFSGITAMAETNVLSLDVASLSQVGRSVTVSVKLVDKYGNAVDTADGAIAVAVTGVGSLSAATVGTDKTGVATVQFVAGANDFGDAVITAKYTATDAAATVVTASKTLTVGVTDAQVDVVNNRVTAVASFSKGKTVGFYVDGVKKWSKLSASDADVVVNYNLKKGRHTVTVKISGGFVTTEVIVVK